MNTYTYNDVSWRVHREINQHTVAIKFLKAKETYWWPLTNFLLSAMGVMSYSCKPGPITYTIAETGEGYSFHMEWETTMVKAQAIQEYSELLKGPERPTTGKTQWRMAVVHSLENLLAYSSSLNADFTPVPGTDQANFRLEATVRFTSLVSAPHIPRLYVDGPQRQVCIFDLFEYQDLERRDLDMEFLVDDEHELAVRLSVPGKQAELTFGDRTCAHRNLVFFLQAIRNIIHSVEEKTPLVNVATIRTSRNYDVEYEERVRMEEDDEENGNWPAPVEVLHTRYVHFRDNWTHCSMDIQNIHRWGKRFNILIREDADLILEDNWFYRNDGGSIERGSDNDQPTRSQMEAPVQLAFSADQYDLRNALRGALPPFMDRFGPERYKEVYGVEPPYELLEQI